MTIITRLASAFAARPRRTRKVVDTNCLQSEALRAYLSASAHNYVILTNYAAMEAYKGDTLKSIYRSMEILAQHPKRVIVLRGAQDICALNGHAAASLEPLIDEVQTREFSEYCQHLLAAKRGDCLSRSSFWNMDTKRPPILIGCSWTCQHYLLALI